MDPDSHSKKAPPVQQTSPEEDATLLAIEALEAQSVDLDTPKPETSKPVEPVVVAAPVPTPIAAPPVPKPAPVAPRPVVAAPKPTPTPVQEQKKPVPKPVAPVAPKKPLTPAEKIAEALASDEPAPKRFQFFLRQKPPRKPFVIGGLVLVLIALGVGAYVTLL